MACYRARALRMARLVANAGNVFAEDHPNALTADERAAAVERRRILQAERAEIKQQLAVVPVGVWTADDLYVAAALVCAGDVIDQLARAVEKRKSYLDLKVREELILNELRQIGGYFRKRCEIWKPHSMPGVNGAEELASGDTWKEVFEDLDRRWDEIVAKAAALVASPSIGGGQQ